MATVDQVVLALVGAEAVEERPDGGPERVFGPRGSFPEQRLQLGEELLDRVQVRRVGWEVEHAGPHGPDRLLDPGHLVSGQIVHHNDIVRFEFRREHLSDVGAERLARPWPIQHKGRDHPACS